MKLNQTKIIKSKSGINYPYSTIKITQSRLEKGLIAIPISLAMKWFPKSSTNIKVYLGYSEILQIKKYSSYESSTKEARIGSLTEWFKQTKLEDNDEIVIQLIDKSNKIYRIIPEKDFIGKTISLQNDLDESENDDIALNKITDLTDWIKVDTRKVALNEYNRIINKMSIEKRSRLDRSNMMIRETIPPNIRIIMEKIYYGHCQVCDFYFLKKDKRPYYEIHHIDPTVGHHPTNLVLVCANCHKQFTFANVYKHFDNNGWLLNVKFNERVFILNQVGPNLTTSKNAKQLFIE